MLPFKLRILKRFDRHIGRRICHNMKPTASFLNQGGDDGRPRWAPRPVPPDGIERILVIRPGGIGDAVLTYPMLTALKQHYSGAFIDVLGERRNVGVYRLNNLVREVYGYDVNPFATLRMLRRRRYQIIIDTEQFHHLSVCFANWLHPEHLCGFDTLGRGRLQTHRVRYDELIYELHSFLGLASALIGHTIEFDRDEPFVEIDHQWRLWATQRLPDIADRPVAVIVPGASTPHKYWAPQRYAEVARWLVKHGYFVVVLGGSDTLQTADLIARDHTSDDLLNLAGETSLPQTAGIVQRASIYVSSDTGALHIAYGVGTPTVHMFGSGVQTKWAPQGRRYVVVNKGLPCSPCTRFGYTPPCPYNVACMEAISVNDVIAAIEEVLSR